MFSCICPNQYVALRLPSDAVKVEQIVPNTLINLGKYGSFNANQILGRPFYLTFEILDRSECSDGRSLRIVPPAELHADALDQSEISDYGEDGSTPNVDYNGTGNVTPAVEKSNMNIHDDPSNQRLTMAEIEALKHDDTASGKEIVAKILQSHSTLDQKTAFSLAKYTLRKNKKYAKRFCVFPLDVASLTDWMMQERDFAKVMEIRNEALGLMGCWGNIHSEARKEKDIPITEPSNRYLVVDDTGGLAVAAMAERMGILHPREEDFTSKLTDRNEDSHDNSDLIDIPPGPQKLRHARHDPTAMSATSNSITLIHANTQPNLSLLRYFSFDSNTPSLSHPLYTRLKTLSWLQLLEPNSDPMYHEPEIIPPELLATHKSSKRSAYYRKRRRWERTKFVIDEARAGGFNGLIVASHLSPVSILGHLVPLLAGGSQVVVYSPHIEPLVELADLYSSARRAAFINAPEEDRKVPSDDFPVDPTLLLVPMVQTARVRKWQVLPGRTHPLMIGRGGAEGYLFVSTRVLPAEGKVTARGRAARKKRAEVNDGHATSNGEEPSAKRAKTDHVSEISHENEVSLPDSVEAMEKVVG